MQTFTAINTNIHSHQYKHLQPSIQISTTINTNIYNHQYKYLQPSTTIYTKIFQKVTQDNGALRQNSSLRAEIVPSRTVQLFTTRSENYIAFRRSYKVTKNKRAGSKYRK